MKRVGRLLVIFAMPLLPEIGLGAHPPSVFESEVEWQGGPPLWISAEAAADPEEIIDLDLVNAQALRGNVEKQRRELGNRLEAEKSRTGAKPEVVTIPLSECHRMMDRIDHRGGDRPSDTPTDLKTYSRSIVRGVIRSIEPGFSFGLPSSLLGVEVVEVVKGPALQSPFYVDYPVARFKIGPYHFCNANKGFEPRAGDEILLFDYIGPVDRDGVFFAPRLDQLFFQSQSGALVLPPPIKNARDLEAARSLDDVVGWLRASPGKGGPQ